MTKSDHLHLSQHKRVPLFLAAEAAECGVACMAMVANYLGHDIDLNGMRQRLSVSILGTTLRGLIGLAEQLGLSTRAIRVDVSEIRDVKTPAILHWDLNHFVVLKNVTKGRIHINDPAIGELTLTESEFSNHFTGVALEVYRTEKFVPLRARQRVRVQDLWSSLTGFKKNLVLVLAMSIALQFVTFALPFQMQLVIDQAIAQSDSNLLGVIAISFGSLVVIQSFISATRDWVLQILGSQMVMQVTANILRHLLRLKISYFETRTVADILSRVSSTKNIQEAVSQGVMAGLIDGTMSIIAASILLIYAPKLALVVFISVAMVILIMFVTYPRTKARTQEMITASTAEQSYMMETVRAMTMIKVMGRESEREGTWRNIYGKNFNASLALGKIQISTSFFQSIIVGLQTILITYLGALEIISNSGLSVGMLTAFLSFRQTFTDRAMSLVNKGFQLRMLGVHLERLGDIVTQVPEDFDLQPLVALNGENIRLENVCFRYGIDDAIVLNDVTMEIRAGDFIAIAGPSGGGKSTLIKLLLGLHSPVSGNLYLNDKLLQPSLWRSWRSQVGLVAQDDRLLSGTVADNIAFFDPEMNMAAVMAAAGAAQVHNEIANMPMGYLSLIGDMGSALSGGQRQRVLLARALYRNPKVLMLDEGTANLDFAAEERIADLVQNLRITRIVVAHRPALINRASRIFWVQDGGVSEISKSIYDSLSKRERRPEVVGE